jgi:hypothetical protein
LVCAIEEKAKRQPTIMDNNGFIFSIFEVKFLSLPATFLLLKMMIFEKAKSLKKRGYCVVENLSFCARKRLLDLWE